MQTQWHLEGEDFFRGLGAEKEAFMSLSRRKELKKNDILFFEDDPGDSCFYLDKGLIKIFKITLLGKEPIYFIHRRGEMLGLAEVIDAKSRKAAAQALTPSVLYEINKKDFENLLADHYPMARKVITILGRRLRYLGEQVENLMVCSVRARLIKLLIYLSYDHLPDEMSWAQPVKVPVGLTQEQVASMIGSCQQTVSELLKSLQKDGLISVSKKEITIINPLESLQETEM